MKKPQTGEMLGGVPDPRLHPSREPVVKQTLETVTSSSLSRPELVNGNGRRAGSIPLAYAPVDVSPIRIMSLRRFLCIERRVCRPVAFKQRTPPSQPDSAPAVLAALASNFPPGSVVTIDDIARTASCGFRTAQKVRVWAAAYGLWPYQHGKGGYHCQARNQATGQPVNGRILAGDVAHTWRGQGGADA